VGVGSIEGGPRGSDRVRVRPAEVDARAAAGCRCGVVGRSPDCYGAGGRTVRAHRAGASVEQLLPEVPVRTARVPLDYDRPRGTKTSLALIRLPASGPGPKVGSIFLNTGGPGGSGVDAVRNAGPVLFSAAVRARFDVVGFDPRGIRRSTPLGCSDSLREAAAVLPPFPVTRAEESIQVQSDRALAATCGTRSGPILNHMATADVARDMNLLRRAVGDRQLTYYGVSNGSYLGAGPERSRCLWPRRSRVPRDGRRPPFAPSAGRRSRNPRAF
jgi:pimeloyl-ACP methyl ester carboxylesterase